MPKSALVLCCIVLAGCASTSGWRSLRIDATDQASFEASVVAFQEELPPNRGQLFALALQDIWIASSLTASDDAGGYTAEDYFEQLDGLGYKEVIDLAESSELLAFEDFAPRVRRAPPRAPVPPSESGAGRYGWGNSIDQFDPSPTGWRPSQ